MPQKADLLIFSGQSNMQGQTECLPSPNPVIGNAFEYKMLGNSLVPLKHPCGEDIGDSMLLMAHQGYGSLPPYFCRSYIEAAEIPVVAVHAARGSTVIADWLPGTERYDALACKINAAERKMSEQFVLRSKYFIWLQGESDAIAGNTEAYYREKIVFFKNTLKKQFNIDKFMIIRVGRFTNDDRDFEIIRAQDKVCAMDSDFKMLTGASEELLKSSHYVNPEAAGHYSNEGFRALGEIAGKACFV